MPGGCAIEKLKIVIADGSPTCRAVVRREFEADRFDVHEADSGDEAVRLARALRPAIVTLSVELPGQDGIAVCAAITSDKSLTATSVLMITAADAVGHRARAFEAGAVRFLNKGFLRGDLARYADEIVRSRSRLEGVGVLVADDNPFTLSTIRRLLESEGATVVAAVDGEAALQLLDEHRIDVIVTDYQMPRMDGITLLHSVRERRDHAQTPVLFLTAAENRHLSVCALDSGANDFIHKPFEATEFLARIRSCARLAKVTAQLQDMATTDDLTGLLNRRQAFVRLRELRAVAIRRRAPLSCVMADIDHFKRINDTQGHAAGDQVLREAAATIRRNCRAQDLVFRMGGEEFLILCPDVDSASAASCAERLRAGVAEQPVWVDGAELRVTMSLGVSGAAEDGRLESDTILREADAALYEAKRAGRNRVAVFDGKTALMGAMP